jgi:hypothetical protein
MAGSHIAAIFCFEANSAFVSSIELLYVIAAGEHVLKQLPQPMQRSGMMEGNPDFESTLIVFTGQIRTQA